MNGLFQVKSINDIDQESKKKIFIRSLGFVALLAIGLGDTIGAGLFSITGYAISNYTGPSIILSFIIGGGCCVLTGLCYAEFASMMPISGTAYTYAYGALGEFVAWFIGWDLILEWTLGASTVGVSWGRYLTHFLEHSNIHLPLAITAGPLEGGIINVPPIILVVILSCIIIRGTKQSSWINIGMVLLKVLIIVLFVVLGWQFIHLSNFTPFFPKNTGTWGDFGISGMMRGISIVFFAYIGFESITTLGQEAKKTKHITKALIISLGICILLYILFAFVLIGVADYHLYKGLGGITPVYVAIEQMGFKNSSGVIIPLYPWLNICIIIAILIGFCSIILIDLLSQSRIIYNMSIDGLLPSVLSRIHKKYKTPYITNIFLMTFCILFVGFLPAELVGELASIGSLIAFIIVALGILVLRYKAPDIPRGFKVPLFPYLPIISIITCVALVSFLPADTWLRLILWVLLGTNIYIFYGIKHSHLRKNSPIKYKDTQSLYAIMIVIAILLLIVNRITLHSSNHLSNSKNITYFIVLSNIIAIAHIILYSTLYLYKKYKKA